jgi:hypothetical protein
MHEYLIASRNRGDSRLVRAPNHRTHSLWCRKEIPSITEKVVSQFVCQWLCKTSQDFMEYQSPYTLGFDTLGLPKSHRDFKVSVKRSEDYVCAAD